MTDAPRLLPRPGPHRRTPPFLHAPELARDEADALAATVRARLRPVCPGWPANRFATLVADVVRFHARWDARDAWGASRTPAGRP